jgi:hypothetical protein
VSINDRLKCLLPPGAQAGEDIAPLTDDWLSDLHAINQIEAEEWEEGGKADTGALEELI